jgi:hypothetical protein
MIWEYKQQATNTSVNSTSASALHTLPTGALRPNDIAIYGIGQDAAAATVTSIVVSTGTGTFVQVAAIDAAARSLAIWLGYNFTGDPTAVTITCSQAGFSGVMAHLITDRDWTTVPTVAASAGNAATSNTADSNTITPAVGDLLVAAVVIPSATADSTSRTHTGNVYLLGFPGESSTIATRVEFGLTVATAAVSSKEVWTLGSSQSWAAIQACITPPVATLTPTAALTVKGLESAALDLASSY